MNGSNFVLEFILLGFPFSHLFQIFLSAVVFIFYTIVLLGNVFIMLTVMCESRLQRCPMYFFLANLSLTDVSLGSVAAPRLAADLLNDGHAISYGGCMAQVFFTHLFGGAEMLLLTVMAYDRYVAICHPLRYGIIMVHHRCLSLLILCWAGGLIHSTIQIAVVTQLPFCGSNVIDHFFCDMPELIKLACMNIHAIESLMIVNSTFLTLSSFLTLLLSYIAILVTLRSHLRSSGVKILSTCSSHLMVVSLFYLPCIIVYLKPFSNSHLNKIVAVFYMVVTPALNPFIYTLRNQEIKDTMKKLKGKCQVFLLPQKEYVCKRNRSM